VAEQWLHHVWMLLDGIQHIQYFETTQKSVAKTHTPQQPFALSNVGNVDVLLSLLAQKLTF